MVVYFDTYKFSLLPKECKSFKQVLQIASMVCYQPQSKINLFFVHPNASETQIESDSDLLSLKYLAKRGEINFKIQVRKSQQQIESELIQNQVSSFLTSSYDLIAEKEIERQINNQLDLYFDQLYKRIMAKQTKHKLKKLEKEQVANYMTKINSQITGRKTIVRTPSIEKRSKVIKASAKKQLFQRKEGNIQSMVKRILESMMPVMIQELSSRIIEELNDSKEIATAHTLNFIDDEERLEYL